MVGIGADGLGFKDSNLWDGKGNFSSDAIFGVLREAVLLSDCIILWALLSVYHYQQDARPL